MASVTLQFVAKIAPTVLILLGSARDDVDIIRDCMISLSDNGQFLAIGNKGTFFLLYLDEDAQEYRLLSRVSGVQSVHESITSLCCFDAGSLIRTSESMDLVFTAVGYSNGTLSIFNKKGKLLQTQLFHPSPVVSITLRLTISKRLELLVYHEGFCIVTIDINEKFLLQMKLPNDDASNAGEQFTWEHKKWRLAVPTTEMSPSSITCLGPLTENEEVQALSVYKNGDLNQIAAPDSSSPLNPTHAINRFLCIGTTSPALSIHFVENSPYLLLSATKLASMVTSSISSFAKSMLYRAETPTDQPPTAKNISPPISVPATFQFNDESRRFTDCSVAPRNYQLAALSDGFGRVWLLDTLNCEFVRMWKGLREAQTGWVELDHGEHVELVLIICAPRRHLLQAYKMKRGKLMGVSSFESKNCSLFTVNNYSDFARTLIVQSDGTVYSVNVKPDLDEMGDNAVDTM